MVPADAFKTLIILLTRLTTCTQRVLNENNIFRYTPSTFVLRTREMSEILIFGWVLACSRSGVNKLTYDFGADINNQLVRMKLETPSSSC